MFNSCNDMEKVMSKIIKEYGRDIKEILKDNQISIVFTSIKPHDISIISSNKEQTILIDDPSQSHPRGISVIKGKLAIADNKKIKLYENVNSEFILVDTIDVEIPVHELHYENEDFYYVSTQFSCINKIDINNQHSRAWSPWWIIDSKGEDLCHLNGFCFVEGELRFATAFSANNSWRKENAENGVVIDIKNKKILHNNIKMPHCPRWHNDKLWFLESKESYLCSIDPSTNKLTKEIKLEGFVRGLSFYNNLAIVGSSKIRKSSIISEKLFDGEEFSAIYLIDLNLNKVVGYAILDDSINEVFDIKVFYDKK